MQYKIFLIIILLTTLAFNISAQSVKNSLKTLTQEEIDKKEVVKFADSFLRSLERTKDISLIPNKFFGKGFKVNLIETYKSEFLRESNNFINQVSDAEVYETMILGWNFFYMAVSINNGLCCEGLKVNKNPSNILKIVKKSKYLSQLYGETDGEPNITNIEKFKSVKADLNEVTKAQRKYLEKLSPKRKTLIRKNWLSTINKFDCLRIFQCKDEDCENSPQGTKMAQFCLFPIVFRIVKIGKAFKLLNIFPYTQ